ncbi:MAG: hypothetical protein ACFFEO_12600 [Candidatus Thorarchaeota archaeon]
MEDPKSVPPTDNQKRGISYNLKNISERSRDYIKDVIVLINKEIGVNKIASIILFGSQRSEKKEESTIISDCDLLFIFKDRVSNRHIKEIEKHFMALEVKHKFKQSNSSLIRDILNILQISTGMFVSHFLTRKKFWDQGNFYKIFRVNRIIAALFAPRNIVLSNVLDNSTVLYGEDLRNNIKPHIKITVNEMFKSTVMNLFIAFFALLITPLTKFNAIIYQLEAIKWTLRTSNYYCFKDTETLNNIIDRFISLETLDSQPKARLFFDNFLKLRKNPKNVFFFMLRTPLRIIKIHVKAIIYKKLVKRKPLRIPSEHKEPIFPDRSFPLQF